jgi:hypothetical protein
MANEPLNEVAYKFYTQEVTAGAGLTNTQLRATAVPVAATPYPADATPLTGTSGNVANAQAQATLAAVSGKTNYLTGLYVSGGGSTAGLGVTVTVSGTTGSSIFFPVVAPVGALLPMQGLQLTFTPPIPASGANVAITATMPALGAGNLYAGVVITGFRI